MRCKHVQERLVESRIRGEQQLPDGLAPHLETCDTCAEEYQLIVRGVEAAGALPHVALPAGLKGRVFDRIAQERSHEPWRARLVAFVRRPAMQRAAAAAMLLVAVGATSLLAAQILNRNEPAQESPGALLPGSLLDLDFVRASESHTAVLTEAVACLEAASDPGEQLRIAEQIRRTDLVRRVGLVAKDAPYGDRQYIYAARERLEDIAKLR
jgi:hypothetical protein